MYDVSDYNPIYDRRTYQKLRFNLKRISLIILIFSFFSLILNVYALFYYPSPDKYSIHTDSEAIIYQLNSLSKQHVKNYYDFSKRIVHLFSIGITHNWRISSSHRLGREFFLNWSLWVFSHLIDFVPDYNIHIEGMKNLNRMLMQEFEYNDYRYALYRGVGLCSQYALAIADFFKKVMHFKSEAIGINGHVVNRTRFPDGSVLILDADYDTVLPFDLEFAHQHPEIVQYHYGKRWNNALDIIYKREPFKYSLYDTNEILINNFINKFTIFNWLFTLFLLLVGSSMYYFKIIDHRIMLNSKSLD